MESEYDYNLKFKELCQLQSFLKKKSPNKLSGYQKRYFCIRDQGRILLYFKSTPEKKSQPIGFLVISQLQAKADEQKNTEFTLTINDESQRVFKLNADNEELRNKWVDAIQFLNKHYEDDKERTRSQIFDNKHNKQWKWKYVSKELRIAFQLEHEKMFNEEVLKKVEEENQRILQAKKIIQNSNEINDELMDRMICGYLFKNHGGEKSIQEMLTKTKKRWFIMIMENPMYDDEYSSDYISPFTLPAWMDFLKFYSFKIDKDIESTTYKKEYNMSSFDKVAMIDIEVNNSDIISQGLREFKGLMKEGYNKFTEVTFLNKLGLDYQSFDYGFQITTKKKELINFYSPNLTEIHQWYTAISKAISLSQKREKEALDKEQENLMKQVQEQYKKQQQIQQGIQPSNPLKIGFVNQPNEEESDEELEEEKQFRDQQNMKNEILKQSTLEVQTSIKIIVQIKPFTNKFATLQRQIIKIYPNENTKEIEQIIILKNAKCEASKGCTFFIQSEKTNDQTVFKLNTEQERDEWVRLINLLITDYMTPKEKLFPDQYANQNGNDADQLKNQDLKDSDESDTDSNDDNNIDKKDGNQNLDNSSQSTIQQSIYDKYWDVQKKQEERGIVINRSQSYLLYSKQQQMENQTGFQKFKQFVCPCFFNKQRKSSKDQLINEDN